MDRLDLSGRTALVTGGSRGIGRAAAQALAEAGADVIVASRNEASCRRAADEIAAATGRRAFAHACHVGHWDELGRLAEAAWQYTGRLDILVNNAGMSPPYDRVTDVTEQLFDKVVGVNLKGPFRLTAVIGSQMAERAGGGSIINVSSVGGVRPQPDTIPYSAAKAGLNAMTVAFAHLLGPAVRVNAVVPGRFLTDVSNYGMRRSCGWPMSSPHCAAPGRRKRWPGRSCTWPATPRVTPAARCCGSTGAGSREPNDRRYCRASGEVALSMSRRIVGTSFSWNGS